MDIHKFLERIAFDQPINHDLTTLAALQQQFLLTVPFENLDIHYGDQPISTEVSLCYKKIVEQKRGGLCFENNTLLAWALRQLGFKVNILSGQMFEGLSSNRVDDLHMVLQVNLDQHRYLVDTGNGQSFRIPLAIDDGAEDCTVEGYCYRVAEFIYNALPYQALYVRASDQIQWHVRYVFNLTPRPVNYFINSCNFQQTSPLAYFIKGPLLTLALPDGRITLTPTTLKKTCRGLVEVTHHDEVTFLAYLEQLGIHLNGKRRDPLQQAVPAYQ